MDVPVVDRRKNPVNATIVGMSPNASPISAMIVGDTRDKFGKRLGTLSVWLLILFFAVNTYIQASRNGDLLEQASIERSRLIETITQTTRTVSLQAEYIRQLQGTISEQNKILLTSGIRVVTPRPFPTPNPRPGQAPTTGPGGTSNTPKPSSAPTAKAPPLPKPTPSPTPTPSPSEGPLGIICELTGLCPGGFYENSNLK